MRDGADDVRGDARECGVSGAPVLQGVDGEGPDGEADHVFRAQRCFRVPGSIATGATTLNATKHHLRVKIVDANGERRNAQQKVIHFDDGLVLNVVVPSRQIGVTATARGETQVVRA